MHIMVEDSCATNQDGENILTNHLMEEAIDKQLANLEEEESADKNGTNETEDIQPTESGVEKQTEDQSKDDPLSATEAMEILTQMSQNVKTILEDETGEPKVSGTMLFLKTSCCSKVSP